MRLLKLRMQNIGPYNMQEIDFSSTDKHNVILICGENGAGKTTIQKAMKIGLFGSYLYGLKTNSKNQNYIDNVKELIKNNCLTGSINIEFSVVDEYMEKSIQFIEIGIYQMVLKKIYSYILTMKE